MEKIFVVKIGGNVIDDQDKLEKFLKDFASYQGKKILIHGGGKIASQMMQSLGIQPELIDGRRITDENTLKIVTMVYGGLINKNIVSLLQSNNCNAIGLTGADANIILAHKREIKDVDYGFVGDIDKIQVKPIIKFIEEGIALVIAPLTHDKKGRMLNTNADTIADALASALAHSFEVHLIYCFEKIGVLSSLEDENSLIPRLSMEEYQQLKSQGIISKGMIPKLDNAFDALKMGVKRVIIGHADNLLNMIKDINKIGTELIK